MSATKVMGLAALALASAGAGVGAYTFIYAEGASYLTDNAAACANCHVMQDQYRAWQRASHHAVATCNDCHTPHDMLGKYLTKATNGYHHSLAFTTGWFHEPIQIKAANLAITEAACRHCHQDIVQAIDTSQPGQQPLSCTRCHPNVGHLH